MSTTVAALKSLAESAGLSLTRSEKAPQRALEDPAIRDVVLAMMRMNAAEKELVLRTVNTLMVARP